MVEIYDVMLFCYIDVIICRNILLIKVMLMISLLNIILLWLVFFVVFYIVLCDIYI